MSVILFFSVIILLLLGLLEAKEDKIKYILYFIIFTVTIGFFAYCNWPAPVKKVVHKKVDEEKEVLNQRVYSGWMPNLWCQSCIDNPGKHQNCQCRLAGGGG